MFVSFSLFRGVHGSVNDICFFICFSFLFFFKPKQYI